MSRGVRCANQFPEVTINFYQFYFQNLTVSLKNSVFFTETLKTTSLFSVICKIQASFCLEALSSHDETPALLHVSMTERGNEINHRRPTIAGLGGR